MTLEDIASGARPPVAVAVIGGDLQLCRQVQDRLAQFGILDPPADGHFGPVSQWALGQFMRRVGTPNKPSLDPSTATSMLQSSAQDLFPLNPTASLAGQITQGLIAGDHWICRHPDCVNIVYVEGLDANGTPNDDAPNIFNDLRLALRISKAGHPEIVGAWEATSEPGRFHTIVKKLDPRGAARIAFGQYKAWAVGTHNVGKKSAHEALVQTKPIKVHRDLNEDFERTGDAVIEGVFGINQHSGFDQPKQDIGATSAGCLVGRTKTGHREFMALCKTDARFVASHGYCFMTAVMPEQALDS
jgi:hypothetical protein